MTSIFVLVLSCMGPTLPSNISQWAVRYSIHRGLSIHVVGSMSDVVAGAQSSGAWGAGSPDQAARAMP